MNPTPEQQACIDAAVTGSDLVITAVAGAGKTSTLRLIALALSEKSMAYVAYNKAIADEAKGKFPVNVTAKTAHAFAFATVGRQYAKRLNSSTRVRMADVAKFLGIWSDLQVGERRLDRYAQVRIVQDMVSKFCRSADDEVSTKHLPKVDGVEKISRPLLAKHLLPFAQKAWADLQSTNEHATMRFTHDHYLKIWALTKPVLPFDVILFDEAQDANPVIDGVIALQTHAQRIYVGDQAQAIYGWNGAIDAMAKFTGTRLSLTHSFRFGQAVADQANVWLAQLPGYDLRVVGSDQIQSRVERLTAPKALLTRTNAGALQAALDLQEQGLDVHLVGGSSDIESFCKAVLDLQNNGWTSHKDLSIFKSWGEVRDFSQNDPDGTDLATLVRLVDQYGAEAILKVLRATVAEKHADVVISTAHKAKGREWTSVRIGDDFAPKTDKEGNTQPLSDEEIMLRYVAVTRAMKVLDPGPLAEVAEPAAA